MRSQTKRLNVATMSYRATAGNAIAWLITILFSFSILNCRGAGMLQAATQLATDSIINVEVDQARLTLTARDAPLVDVLQAIAKRAGIAIKLHGEFRDRINYSFTDIPLEEGIRRILRGQSFALSYAPPTKQATPGRLVGVTVIARPPTPPARAVGRFTSRTDEVNKRQRIRTLSRRNDAEAIGELSDLATSDPNANVRSQAVAALGRQKNRDAMAPLKRALTDQSSTVRIEAMRGIKNLDGVAAIKDLHAMLVNDGDPWVRRQALRLMSELQSPEVPALLQGALSDQDASVRQEAKQSIQRWERRFSARR